MPKQCIVAYIPVLHRGYLQLFDAFPEATELYLIDRSMLADETVDYLRKDLRQLEPVQIKPALEGLQRFVTVAVLTPELCKQLDTPEVQIVMPDEDISRAVAERFKATSVDFYNVFLRWDRRSIQSIDAEDNTVAIKSVEAVERLNQAVLAAQKSPDIWRRVGAVLVDAQNQIINSAANIGEPTQFSPWIEGDPRNIFNRGVGIEMSVFTHAEAGLIAEAARDGIALKGAKIYVLDFPCPACAKLIAHSGISEVFYANGYAVLDGERILKDFDVAIHKVAISQEDSSPEVWVPYKKS